MEWNRQLFGEKSPKTTPRHHNSSELSSSIRCSSEHSAQLALLFEQSVRHYLASGAQCASRKSELEIVQKYIKFDGTFLEGLPYINKRVRA